MQRQRQQAVGTQVVHQRVRLGAGGGERPMVPLQGQTRGTYRGVEGGTTVATHIQVVHHQTVAAAAARVVEHHIGGIVVEQPSAIPMGKVVLIHRVVDRAAGGGMEQDGERSVEHTPYRVGDKHRIRHRRVGREVERCGDDKRRVAAARDIRTQQVGIRYRRHILVARKAVGIQCQLPAEDIAVVTAPSVDNLDIPRAVHRATYQVRKRVVGVVELRARRHIRRVERVAHKVRIAVNQAVARGVAEACVRAVRPTVAPAHARLVVLRRRVARRPPLRVVRLPQIGTHPHIAARLPASAAGGNTAVAIRAARAPIPQYVGRLVVGTGNVDIDVAHPRVLYVQHHIAYVVHVAYMRVALKARKHQLRTVRTSVRGAILPVGQKYAR